MAAAPCFAADTDGRDCDGAASATAEDGRSLTGFAAAGAAPAADVLSRCRANARRT